MSAPDTTQKSSARRHIFRTLNDVRSYLVGDLGLKVSLRTLQKRSAEGVLRVDADGLWDRTAVDALAKTLPKAVPQNGAPASPPAPQASPQPALPKGGATLAEIKLKAEIKKVMAQTAGIEHENAVKQGKYFRKADVWLELAHRAAVLYAGLAQDMYAVAPDVVRATLEDPARGEEAFRQAFDRALAQGINSFSRPMKLEVETWTDEIADDDIPAAD